MENRQLETPEHAETVSAQKMFSPEAENQGKEQIQDQTPSSGSVAQDHSKDSQRPDLGLDETDSMPAKVKPSQIAQTPALPKDESKFKSCQQVFEEMSKQGYGLFKN